MRFSLAPMSRPIGILTVVLLIVFGLLSVGFVVSGFLWRDGWLGIPVGLVLLMVLNGIYLYARPGRFELTQTHLRLIFPLRVKQVPLAEIVSVQHMAKTDLCRSIRLFGAGGVWGFFGLIWSPSIGKYDAYVSNPDRLVRMDRRPGRPLIVSPAQPEEFVSVLRAALAAQAETTPAPEPA